MEISKTYGIGSSAFYKSLKTLKQLNLVKEDKQDKKTITTLTEKGYQVAKKVSEINDILNTTT
jgi:predicted transcriptional regulator